MEFDGSIPYEEFKKINKGNPLFGKEVYDRVKNMSWEELVARHESTLRTLDKLIDSMETKPSEMV